MTIFIFATFDYTGSKTAFISFSVRPETEHGQSISHVCIPLYSEDFVRGVKSADD